MRPASCDDPTHAELRSELEVVKRQLAELPARERAREREAKQRAKEIAALRSRNADLEARLQKTSRNSSRPPSSDSPYKDRPSRSKPTGRKPGGQPGHTGATRPLVPPEDVDDTKTYGVEACPDCAGTDLEQLDAVRHQVTELPEVKPKVIDHIVLKVRCRGCGACAAGELPPDVARSQFGPRVHALATQLMGDFRLTHREVARVFDEMFGMTVGVGSLTAMQRRVTAALEYPFRVAQRALRLSPAGFFDETLWWVGRKKAWLWVAHFGELVVFHVDRRRNRAAFRRLLGGKFYGTRVVDRIAVHDDVADVRRQLCLAHLLRDLEGFVTGPAGRRLFGRRGKAIVIATFRAWWSFLDGRSDRAKLQATCRTLHARMVALLDEAAEHSHARVRNFAKHLRKQVDCLFTFAYVEGIEATSNPAERMLRPAVLWRKGSFGSHSTEGARFVSRFLTAAKSLRLQGRNVGEFLVEALDAHVYGRAPPSLVPASAAAAS